MDSNFVEEAQAVVLEMRRQAAEWGKEHPYYGLYLPEESRRLRWFFGKAISPQSLEWEVRNEHPEHVYADENGQPLRRWPDGLSHQPLQYSEDAIAQEEDAPDPQIKTIEEVQQEKRERNAAISEVMSKIAADAGDDDVQREARHERAQELANWMLKANGPFVPANEMETIFLFVSVMHQVGWDMVALKPNQYPDGVMLVDGQILLVEFEHTSTNFITHGHDARGADLVVCWHKNKLLPIPCVALDEYFDSESKVWNVFDLGAALRAAIRTANHNFAALLAV